MVAPALPHAATTCAHAAALCAARMPLAFFAGLTVKVALTGTALRLVSVAAALGVPVLVAVLATAVTAGAAGAAACAFAALAFLAMVLPLCVGCAVAVLLLGTMQVWHRHIGDC
jgi:hypothetical protein